MKAFQHLIDELPDPASAERFLERFEDKAPKTLERAKGDPGLFSDLVTIAAYSPLLSETLLENTEYVDWLRKIRREPKTFEKEDFLEELARFRMMNSALDTGVLLSRFRRRELIRVYLKDIRGLETIAEITAEISNLADAIVEHALIEATREIDNKFGMPFGEDENGRRVKAEFVVVSLGKLGSKELNYSSDIDLLFLYSHEGNTAPDRSREPITNREYFIKLSERLVKIVGSQTGEGASYRVDVRLRPHGKVGKLALSVMEADRYYKHEAREWERQVLIRSRASAGSEDLFEEFHGRIIPFVFREGTSEIEALNNVKSSKQLIDSENRGTRGFNVKIGTGGIREIEFIAQALQLAHGGNDKWLRAPHTLISLSRLGDRGLIGESELTDLFEAYKFLRRLEHRLQMEHGLQTHTVPDEIEKRLVISQRMGIQFVADFNSELTRHTKNVSTVFVRVFGDDASSGAPAPKSELHLDQRRREDRELSKVAFSAFKSDTGNLRENASLQSLKIIARTAPQFSRMLAANPKLIESVPMLDEKPRDLKFGSDTFACVEECATFAETLSEMRKIWAQSIIRIASFDAYRTITTEDSRIAQTSLAESAIEAALRSAVKETGKIYGAPEPEIPLAVFGLGKLGTGGMDYESDLDLVLIYDDELRQPELGVAPPVVYAKTVELFVTALSGMTRDGSLYRVDLRLRPDGKNGLPAIAKSAFLNYLEQRAKVWEWLAYVKLRGICGFETSAKQIETAALGVIHSSAVGIDSATLREEAYSMRKRLEEARTKRGFGIDLKFGEGGLQDVYFAIRYLQLAKSVPDGEEGRSTSATLHRLRNSNHISLENFMAFKHGYEFLSELDHSLRLNIGRSKLVPQPGSSSLEVVMERMGMESEDAFFANLTAHRHAIHEAFENVFSLSD
ncbi:MAG: hypothetical protein R2684_01390 [Pyrinomonadaceae bacterium]